MLDQNVLNSVLSTGGVAKTEGKKSEKADGDAFSAALGEASKEKTGKSKESKSEAKEKEVKKQEAREFDERQKQQADRAKDRTSSAYIHKLMKKNVDTLSLSEKQALRVAEFASDAELQSKAASQNQATPQAAMPQATAAGKMARVQPDPSLAGKEASPKVRLEAERADEKTLKAVEDLRLKEQPKAGAANLDQLLAKESQFTEEMSKAGNVEKAQERQSVIDQIMQQIEVRNFANRTELNFRLNPEYLGELSVKLVHTDDGVRADFETSSKRTRELLRDGEEDLRTQAADKGVRLKTMRFTLVDKVQGSTEG